MTPEALGEVLAEARLGRRALSGFPLVSGLTETAAYVAQAAQRRRLPAAPGWKVGTTLPEVRERTGIARFFGPASYVLTDGANLAAPIIPGGFAAVEPELILRLATHPEPGAWEDPGALASVVDALHLGAEIAGSPAPDIMAHGPTGAIADLGNCLGLVVGPRLDASLLCNTTLAVDIAIDGIAVNAGDAASLPDGPLGCLADLLRFLDRQGERLAPGSWISTGAIAGVNPVGPGSAVRIASPAGAFRFRIAGCQAQDSQSS